MKERGMKAFVTGATGFIGSHLVDRLIAEGHEVTVLVRKSSNRQWLPETKIRLVEGDLHDSKALEACVKGQDWIFHVGGQVRAVRALDFEKTNVQGTANLMQAITRHAPDIQQFIFLSSLEAGGPSTLEQERHEADADAPISTYGHSKLQAEQVVNGYKNQIPVLTIRPPIVFGPRDTGVYEGFRLIQYGIRIQIGSGDNWLSTIYVENLVDALLHCAQTPSDSGAIYYVSDQPSRQTSFSIQNDMALVLKKSVKITIFTPIFLFWGICQCAEIFQQLTRKPQWVNRGRYQAMIEKSWMCNSDKIRQEMGFSPKISTREGLRITAEWYQKMGWIQQGPSA